MKRILKSVKELPQQQRSIALLKTAEVRCDKPPNTYGDVETHHSPLTILSREPSDQPERMLHRPEQYKRIK